MTYPLGRRSTSLFICALVAIALIPAATTIVGAVIRGSLFALIETDQFRGNRPGLLPLAVMLMAQISALGLVAVGCHEWRKQGSFGSGTGWLAAVAACVATILLGSTATIVRVVTMGLATILGLKPSMVLAPDLLHIVHWMVFAELVALLILPWLLSHLPRGPALSPTAPIGGPPRTPRPDPTRGLGPSPAAAGAVSFGRRGTR